MPKNTEEIVVAALGPWGGVRYQDASELPDGKAALAMNVETNLNAGALTPARQPIYLCAINSNLTIRTIISRVIGSVTPPVFTPSFSEQFYFIGYNNTGSYPVGSVPGTLGALAVYRVDRNNLPVMSMSQCYIYGSLNFLGGPNIGTGTSIIPAEEFGDQIYFSTPDGYNGSALGPGYRIDANGEVWTWMPQPPATVPLYSAGGAGALNGQYEYLYTYTGSGFETSPSNFSNPVTLTVSNQSVNLTLYGSNDSTVTGINIYRYSKLSAVDNFILVGSIVLSGSGPYTYNDNLPDSQAVGQTITLHNDPPPGFCAIRAWKNRMFGLASAPAGTFVQLSGSKLYYSSYANARAFDTTNSVIPIGLSSNSDIGVALAIVNDALLVFNKYSVWVVGGDSPSDFIPQPLFPDIGAFNIRCVVEAEQGVFWLAADAQIYYFGTSLQIVSQDVQDFLYENFPSFGDGTTLSFKDNVLYFYPGFGTVSLEYNVKTQQWYNGYPVFTTPFSKRNRCYGAQNLGTPSIYELPGSSLNSPLSLLQYQSKEFYTPTDANEKQFMKFVITAMMAGFTLLFEVDPSTLGETPGPTFAWTPPGVGGDTSTIVVNFPRNMIGKRMRITITGSVIGGVNQPVYIRKIKVYAQPDRELTPAG